jgi:hypothetical protein
MANHVSLEGIAENAWDADSEFLDKLKAFGKECAKNLPFEWKCIAMCEAGDIAGTYASAATSAYDFSNEIGFLSGVFTGLGYAYAHTVNDAKKHGVEPSFTEAAMAAGTAEAGCVTAATAVVYYFGSRWGIDFSDPVLVKDVLENWKLYAQDFGIRLSSLIPALPIGLLAMSSFTFPKKGEAGRLVAKKGSLYDVADFLRENYAVTDKKAMVAKLAGSAINESPTVRVYGNNSMIKIREQRLPSLYHGAFSQKDHSLYRVFSSGAKYSPEAKKSAEGLVCRAFSEIGLGNHFHVRNPFLHEHSHSH